MVLMVLLFGNLFQTVFSSADFLISLVDGEVFARSEFFPLQELGYDRHQLSAQECDKLKVRLCDLLLFAVIHLRKVLVGIQC